MWESCLEKEIKFSLEETTRLEFDQSKTLLNILERAIKSNRAGKKEFREACRLMIDSVKTATESGNGIIAFIST